jgi:hypothetical protein
MDPAQIIIFIVVIALTSLLLFLGVQAFYVLREFRQTLVKTNKILDTANEITESISNPVSAFSSVISGVKTGSVIASLFKKMKFKEDKGGK